MRASRATVWLVAALVAACDRAATPPVVCDAFDVHLGKGPDRFEPMEDGETLTEILGLQGFSMISVGVRANGVVPGNPGAANPDKVGPLVRYVVRRPSFPIPDAGARDGALPDPGLILGPFEFHAPFVEVEGVPGTFETCCAQLVMCIGPDCGEFYDGGLRIAVDVVDQRGCSGSAVRTVGFGRYVPPPRDAGTSDAATADAGTR